MFYVIISWCVLAAAIASVGEWTRRAFAALRGHTFRYRADVFQLFWLGLAVLLAVSQVWSVVLPLNGVALAVVLAVGLAGLPGLLRTPCQPTCSVGQRWRGAVFLAVAALLVGRAAAGVAVAALSGEAGDTELYHLTAIRWANTYPAVPGLANLHVRLGLNSGFLTLAALVDNLWWDRRAAWLTNGLPIVVAALQWTHTIAFKERRTPLRARLFCLFSFPWLLGLVAGNAPNLYCDKATFLLQAVVILELLRFPFVSPRPGGPRVGALRISRNAGLPLALMLAVASAAFVFKPSSAVTTAAAFAICVTALVACRFAPARAWGAATKVVAVLCAIPAVLGAGHLARNAILSGWLLFPAPVGCMYTDWAVPENPTGPGHIRELQSVRGHYNVIRAWARAPSMDAYGKASRGFRYWFPSWYSSFDATAGPRLLRVGAGALAVWLAVGLAFRQRRSPEFALECGLVLMVGLSIVYWFLMAPDIRFGEAFLWFWAAMGLSLLVAALPARAGTCLAFACLLLVLFVDRGRMTCALAQPVRVWSVGKAIANPTHAVTLANGQLPPLVVWVPKAGDKCGDAPLPCTPCPRDDLLLRKPGSLRHGFRQSLDIRPTFDHRSRSLAKERP